jgi:hypothetical protein
MSIKMTDLLLASLIFFNWLAGRPFRVVSRKLQRVLLMVSLRMRRDGALMKV